MLQVLMCFSGGGGGGSVDGSGGGGGGGGGGGTGTGGGVIIISTPLSRTYNNNYCSAELQATNCFASRGFPQESCPLAALCSRQPIHQRRVYRHNTAAGTLQLPSKTNQVKTSLFSRLPVGAYSVWEKIYKQAKKGDRSVTCACVHVRERRGGGEGGGGGKGEVDRRTGRHSN